MPIKARNRNKEKSVIDSKNPITINGLTLSKVMNKKPSIKPKAALK